MRALPPPARRDVAEVIGWLERMSVSGPAFNRLKKRLKSPYNFAHRPSVAIAQANCAALQDVLFMDREQARSHCLPQCTVHLFPCQWHHPQQGHNTVRHAGSAPQIAR